MEYDNLVQLTLSHPALAQAAEVMANESGAVNLVDVDWKKKLYAYGVHQSHLDQKVVFSKGKYYRDNKVFVRNIIKPTDIYKVIVLGAMYYDYSSSSPSFISKDCPPLTEIGKAMRENVQHNLHDGAKLFFDICDPLMCIVCKEAHKKHKIDIDRERNWCVSKLRVYDGRNLNFTFKKSLEDIMRKIQFLAICQVAIKSRSLFGDNKYKIGGNISNIIVFQQSVIQSRQKMSFMVRDDSMPKMSIEEEEDVKDKDKDIVTIG